MPSSPLRRRLRAHGHALGPLVRIGKEGITPSLLRQLGQILFDHELCKVKLEAECPVDRFAAAARLGEQPGTGVVQILGRTILVYKRHPQKPCFEGPAASRPGARAATTPQTTATATATQGPALAPAGKARRPSRRVTSL